MSPPTRRRSAARSSPISSLKASRAGRPSSSTRRFSCARVTVRGPAERGAALTEGGGDLDRHGRERDPRSGTPSRRPPGAAQRPPPRSARPPGTPPVPAARASTATAASGWRGSTWASARGMAAASSHPRVAGGEGRPGLGAAGEQAVPVPRQIQHERRRPGLAVVLLPRRDHPVSGGRHPVGRGGARRKGRRHPFEVGGERLGGVEDAEAARGAAQPRCELRGHGAPVVAQGDGRDKRFGILRQRGFPAASDGGPFRTVKRAAGAIKTGRGAWTRADPTARLARRAEPSKLARRGERTWRTNR